MFLDRIRLAWFVAVSVAVSVVSAFNSARSLRAHLALVTTAILLVVCPIERLSAEPSSPGNASSAAHSNGPSAASNNKRLSTGAVGRLNSKSRGGAWRVKWNKKHGVPRMMSGASTAPYGADAETAAKAFLDEHADIFIPRDRPGAGRRGDDNRFDLRSTKSVKGGSRAEFQQTLSGIPVYHSSVIVMMDPDGRVLHVSNAARRFQGMDTTPANTIEEIDVLFRARIETIDTPVSMQDHELVIYPGSPPRLAYRVIYQLGVPAEPWEYVLDAETGETLRATRLVREALPSGTLVFNPNPVNVLDDDSLTDQGDADAAIPDEAYEEVTLTHLNPPVAGLYSLEGDYAEMDHIVTPINYPPTSASTTFHFTRADDGFEEVMAYYHVTRNQEYIQSLGFANANNRPIRIDAHGDHGGTHGAWYVYNPVGAGYMAFADGNVDTAEDADAILHEYAHAIQDNSSNGKYIGSGVGNETDSMGEGFGDYWAASSTYAESIANGYDPAVVAEWYSSLGLRRVDETKHYPEDLNTSIHDNGEIWSACLWEMFAALGKTVTDTLVLQSHFLISYNATFEDGALAILSADEQLYSGSHVAQIRDIFMARGILGDAYEENDYDLEAYHPGYKWDDTWLSDIGGLGIQEDDDWYRIEVGPADFERVVVSCLFSHAEGDIDIQLWNDSEQLLDSGVSSNDNEGIDYVVSGPGTYYIRIFGAHNGNQYDLKWEDLGVPYDIDTSEDPWDGGSTSGDGRWSFNTTATVVASASSGYQFVSWTEDDTVVSNSATYAFTVTRDRSLVANFQEADHEIDTSASPPAGGTTTGGGWYVSGWTATLVASANPGYEFVNWTRGGSVVSTSATYAFSVTRDRSFVANFQLAPYSIGTSASPPAGGTTTGGGTYTSGATATVVASANADYEFVNWTEGGSVVSSSATYGFTVTGSRTLVANFQLILYGVGTSESPAAGGTTTGGGMYASGSTATAVATANPNYQFVNWTEGGSEVSTSATYGFTVTGDRTLVANFQLVLYGISASASPAAGGATTGGGVYASGSTAQVVATANPGYQFENWTEGGSVVSGSETYSFTVTGHRALVANFVFATGTTLSGDISSDMTLLLGGSPYILSGLVNVWYGATLVIQQGVVVQGADTSSKLLVDGVLVAAGTPSQPIVFTSLKDDDTVVGDTNADAGATSGAAGDWAGIEFGADSWGSLDDVEVRYAGSSSIWLGADSGVTINNSTIRDGAGNGIDVAHLTSYGDWITGTEIYGNTGSGIHLDSCIGTIISDNTIRDNGGDGIENGGCSGETITDNVIQTNGGDGISGATAEANSITGNVISGNAGFGMAGGSVSEPVIAVDNYWGDSTGPLDDSDDTATGGLYNPGGLGDPVTDYVLYDPWLAGDPNLDTDADGVDDASDNCLYEPNAGQEDSGGIAGPSDPSGVVPDGIGDACQCGDVTDDGKVTGIDATIINRWAVGLPPGMTAPEKCIVIGTECNGVDSTIIVRTVVGLPPGITQLCDAAQP